MRHREESGEDHSVPRLLDRHETIVDGQCSYAMVLVVVRLCGCGVCLLKRSADGTILCRAFAGTGLAAVLAIRDALRVQWPFAAGNGSLCEQQQYRAKYQRYAPVHKAAIHCNDRAEIRPFF